MVVPVRSSVQPPTYAVKIFLDTTSLETASSYKFLEKYQQTKRARKAEKEKSAMVQVQNC